MRSRIRSGPGRVGTGNGWVRRSGRWYKIWFYKIKSFPTNSRQNRVNKRFRQSNVARDIESEPYRILQPCESHREKEWGEMWGEKYPARFLALKQKLIKSGGRDEGSRIIRPFARNQIGSSLSEMRYKRVLTLTVEFLNT